MKKLLLAIAICLFCRITLAVDPGVDINTIVNGNSRHSVLMSIISMDMPWELARKYLTMPMEQARALENFDTRLSIPYLVFHSTSLMLVFIR